jgi:NAD(P)-dependent dehydrogenase (short-subunit alcohol dehydrogenase family)
MNTEDRGAKRDLAERDELPERTGMKELTGRVAVVTGGASGIGLGMARAFAGAGMKVVIGDLDTAALEAAVTELSGAGASVVGRRCDVSQLSENEALADLAVDTFGGVNVFCANAGVGIPTATHKMKLDDWKWIIDVDLWGPIYGVNVFLPLIEERGEGHVNATASMAGLIASQMMGAYNVAKFGVVALMSTLERDLRGRRSPITASVLCPGPINTNISRHSVEFRPGQAKPRADGETSARTASAIQSMLEQGMDPDEVGHLVLEAVTSARFWVLTHPHWAKALQRQVDALVTDQSLSRA